MLMILGAVLVTEVVVAVIAVIGIAAGGLITNFFNKRQRKADPLLTEAQTGHEEAATAASFVSSAKELVTLLTTQLDTHKEENKELHAAIVEQRIAHEKLMVETKLLRLAEEDCTARLQKMSVQIEQLHNQVNGLSEQVRSLGGQPQLSIL